MQISISRIPDDALVVRGGKNQTRDIQRGTGTHPAGITGCVGKCAEDVPVAELAKTIPHRQIGMTTVAEVRKAGGDVVRTTGRSPYHATADRTYA